MPTYQYRCTSCGRDLEVVQKFTDPTLTECPTCQGELRKVFNAVGVVFKGSGFYRTDSRSSDGKAASGTSGDKSGENSDKPAEKTGDKKTEKTSTPAEAGSGSAASGKPSSGGTSSSGSGTKAAAGTGSK